MVKKIFLILSVLLMTACNNKMIVYNSNSDKVIAILKEYAGLHGYNITYANERTGSYRIELGTIQLPTEVKTTTTKSQYSTANINQVQHYPLTAYEEKTWQSYYTQTEKIMLAIIVRIQQQDRNVVISINPDANSENFLQTNHLKRLKEMFKNYGYQVDFI